LQAQIALRIDLRVNQLQQVFKFCF
jgi:hypothetical protein